MVSILLQLRRAALVGAHLDVRCGEREIGKVFFFLSFCLFFEDKNVFFFFRRNDVMTPGGKRTEKPIGSAGGRWTRGYNIRCDFFFPPPTFPRCILVLGVCSDSRFGC